MRTINAYECDPDFRRDPKTDCFCWRCQKDLRSQQVRRYIFLINDYETIVHPDDVHLFVDNGKGYGWHAVGMDCAKKIGMEWTHNINETGQRHASNK